VTPSNVTKSKGDASHTRPHEHAKQPYARHPRPRRRQDPQAHRGHGARQRRRRRSLRYCRGDFEPRHQVLHDGHRQFDGDRLDDDHLHHDRFDLDLLEHGLLHDHPAADPDGGDLDHRPRTGHDWGVVGIIESATWRALGTTVQLLVADGDLPAARKAVTAVLDEVDRTYSRFRADSEISRLNARAGQVVPISPLLAEAVGAALRASRASDGLVDPTVGRAMRMVGYDDDFATIVGRTDSLVLRLEPVPGWQAVRLDARRRTVRIAPGVELDLGSTGKALASDMAAAAAGATSCAGALVGLGGDIATWGRPPDGGWRVLAAEDHATPADESGEVIALHAGSIATSGTTVRRWRRGDVTLHHLIDPRSGLPAVSPWRTASVIAATCVDANTAATAAVIRGGDAPEWLDGLGLAARLVSVDGQIRRMGGWPQPREAA
jgi:thiamine biosynthesis lipoprotein